MRTAAELTAELYRQAEGAKRAGLVIHFESTGFVVWAGDANLFRTLEEALQLGGEAICWLRILREGGRRLITRGRLLPEHNNDVTREDVEEMLSGPIGPEDPGPMPFAWEST